MLSKKGESSSFFLGEVGKLILIFIGFIVIIGILAVLFNNRDIFSELACTFSNNLDDQFHGFFPNLCRTLDKVSEADDVREIKWEIAESMRKCWNQWGKGELNPEGKNVFKEDEFKCFRCYRLSFPEFEGQISAADIDAFLGNPENVVRGYDDSFINYFNNRVLLNFNDPSYLTNMIRKDQKYAVSFVEHVEKSYLLRTITAASGAGVVGGGTGIAICATSVVGIPALAGCAVVGGALGAVSGVVAGTIEYGIDEFVDWFSGEDKDSIMFSLYDEARLCGEEID